MSSVPNGNGALTTFLGRPRVFKEYHHPNYNIFDTRWKLPFELDDEQHKICKGIVDDTGFMAEFICKVTFELIHRSVSKDIMHRD